MAIALRILPGDRTLEVPSGTTILRSAHGAGVDITATCGGRGRCTSCRVKFVAGAVPPPTIMDELQLGDDLVREGYRLSCQCAVTEPITVQVAPPTAAMARVAIHAGIDKQVVTVALPKDEHRQTSDLEQLLAAIGADPEDVAPELLKGLPQALRQDQGQVTVTRFG